MTKRAIKTYVMMLLGLLISQSAFSQERFFPGYIINLEGDTIKGFVSYKKSGANPDEIYFKTKAKGFPGIFKPNDIAEFKTEEDVYVSAIVEIEITPTKVGKLDRDPELNIVIDTVFLQTLFFGEKSLYYLKSNEGRMSFYIKQGADFELLVYKRYIKRNKEHKSVIAENNQYLSQLNIYLNDCESVPSELANFSYNRRDMVKLFRHYYKCFPSGIYFQKEIPEISTEFGALAGVSSTNLSFEGTIFPHLINTDFSTSLNFSAGVFFDIILPRKLRRWSLYNEFLFSTYRVTGFYDDIKSEEHYRLYTSEIGYSHLKLNTLARYTYKVGSWGFFINGGISNGYAISETNYRIEDFKYYSIERIEEREALESAKKFERGFVLGTGLQYKKFSLDLRYEAGNGMSRYIALDSFTKRYYLLVGYRF